MADKRRIYGVSTVTATLLVVAILVVLNLVSTRFFARADLTDGDIYSLSPASRSVASNVDDPLIAKVYISPDLPANLITVRQYLLDLLGEYRAYGKGNFQFTVVHPSTPEEEKEAQAYRISPFQANVYQQDKVELKRVYLGLVFIHADRQEPIPAITSTDGLEYKLTSAIRRVTRQSLGVIGVVDGVGGPTLQSGLSRLQQSVGQEYQIRSVDITTGPVPAEVTVLAVIGPQSNLSDTALYRLDQYVMRGGPVLFLLDGATVNMQAGPQQGGGLAMPVASNVDTLAQYYGAAPEPELVVDARHNQVQAMQNMGIIQIPVSIDYPFFVAAASNDQHHVLGKEIKRIDLLFASPLKLSPQPEATVNVLVRSSDKSGTRSLPAMVMPPVNIPPTAYTEPDQPLVAAIEGTLTSYFADTSHTAPDLLGPVYDTAFIPRSVDTRMVVVGDADLAGDQAMTQSNNVFVLNALDWLTRNDLLIALRSRQVQDRPLENLDPEVRGRVKLANLLGPPLLVILFGLFHWRRRAVRKRNV